MEKFESCLNFVLNHEGYKSDQKDDSGGKTIFGISSASFPVEVAQMDKMTFDEARQVAKGVYYRNFWVPMNCDNYYPRISLALFDSAVQHGAGRVQGWVKELTAPKGNIEVLLTAHDLLFRREQFYLDIIKNNPSQVKFFVGENERDGWIQRVVDIMKYPL